MPRIPTHLRSLPKPAPNSNRASSASSRASRAKAILKELTDEEVAFLEADWFYRARPEQLAPPGDWRIWLFLGGRGAGKTRSGAEWIADGVANGTMRRIGLVGATFHDARAVMIEGESGLARVAGNAAVFEPSNRRVLWSNGAVASVLSADEPDSIRGHQFDTVWADAQLKLNKHANTDTASLLYQTNYSGRAEMGLTGDDSFHIKVSADGASWKDALAIDRSTGAVNFTQITSTTTAPDNTIGAGEFRNTNAAFTGHVLFVSGSNPVPGAYYLIQGYDMAGGTTKFIVAGNGNVMNTGNSYGAISDVRLKQDIADAASQWSDIKALKLRRYRLKGDVARDPDANFQLGLVAQEAAEVSPHLITTGPIDDLTDAQGIKYSVLYLKALGALQEAMARIEALEARAGVH